MPRDLPIVLRIAALWVLYGAWASATGWILSWMHQLHAAGYAVAAFPLAAVGVWWWTRTSTRFPRARRWHKGFRRLRTFPPFCAWVMVTFLILLGGILHPPSNYDALTYRLPRLLYWLQEHHWFWIGSIDYRLDIAGTGFEWMSAPLLLATGSDRALFLLNFIPYLLLPGLFFVAAKGLGIRSCRVRWWMWVWPMAYGIVLQAASIGNDLVGAALAITSLAFAAHARRGQPVACLAVSALAALLMTGIKITTLPLGLPLAFFWLWQAWHLLGLKRLLLLGTAVVPVGALVSFMPMAWLCWCYTGAWNANPGNRLGIEAVSPVAGIINNSYQFAKASAYPPVLPGVAKIDRWMKDSMMGHDWYARLTENDPAFDIALRHELPTEEAAGIGLGVTLVALAWCVAALRYRRNTAARRSALGAVFAACTLIAMIVFMARVGFNSAARLMIPFTPFLVFSFLLLIPPIRRIPANRWALLPALFLLPTLLLNPNRPLVPVSLIGRFPGIPQSTKDRIATVYAVYSRRGELLEPFCRRIPAGDSVGFGGGHDHSPLSLLRPLGTRRVLELSPQTIDSVDWVLATESGLESRLGMPWQDWKGSLEFRTVQEEEIASKVKTGPERWILYRRER